MKPNIVLLLTDDQDERSLSLVPGVEKAIGAAGGTGPAATSDRALVNPAGGCASRAAAERDPPGGALSRPRGWRREGARGGRGHRAWGDVRPGLRHDAGVLHFE